MKRLQTNLIFMFLILGMFTIPAIFQQIPGFPSDLSTVAMYLVILVIFIIMMAASKTKFFDVLPYNQGFKPLSLLWVIILAFLMMPVAAVLEGAVSLVVPDVMSSLVSSALSDNIIVSLLTIAVVPAVFEEMFFRGIIYSGIKRNGGTVWALILSSILFGFFHMNFQQILYAVVLGFVLALIREITGSMWPGMIYHFVNNGWSVAAAFMLKDSNSFMKYMPIENLSLTTDTGHTIYTLVLAVVCAFLAVLVIRSMAKSEGQTERLKSFFKGEKGEGISPINAAMIIGFAICVIVSILMVVGGDSISSIMTQMNK